MFTRTAYAVMAATAFTLSLALMSPAVAATAASAPQTTNADAGAQIAKGSAVRTMFGTTAPREGGETLGEAVARQDARYGRVRTLRLFFGGMPGDWASIREATGARPVVVSFKADPVQVAAGAYDAQFTEWFATAPTDVRTWWSFWHEPEDDIERGGFTAEQYRAAWAHLDALETAVRNKNLRSTLILMCWTLENGSNRDWHNYYVPGAIEMMGWDCYNAGYKNGNYRTPEKMYAQVLEIATETALPFGLSEFGSVIAVGDDDGAARADWLDRSSAYLAANGAKFVTYFDSNIGVEFRLSDENSRAAWARSVASSYPTR